MSGPPDGLCAHSGAQVSWLCQRWVRGGWGCSKRQECLTLLATPRRDHTGHHTGKGCWKSDQPQGTWNAPLGGMSPPFRQQGTTEGVCRGAVGAKLAAPLLPQDMSLLCIPCGPGGPLGTSPCSCLQSCMLRHTLGGMASSDEALGWLVHL